MKLPEPAITMVHEAYEGWQECEQSSDWFQLKDEDSRMTAYTADQMRQAIKDALEEAAKVCGSVDNYANPMTANDCAESIRNLKGDV